MIIRKEEKVQNSYFYDHVSDLPSIELLGVEKWDD